jgi:hypothetical protein
MPTAAARSLLACLAALVPERAVLAEDGPAPATADADPDVRAYVRRELLLHPPALVLVPTEPRDRSFLLPAAEALAANVLVWSWSK